MSDLQTYGLSIVWKPDNEVAAGNNLAKQIATSGQEVAALKLSSGAGSAAVALYDATSAGGANYSTLRWFLDTSTTDNDMQSFPNPLNFKNGIYAVLEQGSGFNPVLCLEIIPAAV